MVRRGLTRMGRLCINFSKLELCESHRVYSFCVHYAQATKAFVNHKRMFSLDKICVALERFF